MACIPLGVPARAQTVKPASTTSTLADRDSYVTHYSPTSNYGGKDWLIFGDYIDWAETYIHFSFSDQPSEWEKAEIEIDFYYVSETVKAKVCVVSNDWEELEIDWTNKPGYGTVITTLTIAEDEVYTFDVTDYVKGNGLSICIYAADYSQEGYVQARSKEDDSSSRPGPKLKWIYTPSSPSSSSWMSILGVIAVVVVLSIFAICYFQSKKEERIRAEEGRRETIAPVKSLPPPKAQTQQSPNTEKGSFCQYCGNPLLVRATFCTNCGNKVDD